MSERITAAPEPDRTDTEATFLFEVRKRTDILTITQATDDQLLNAAHEACAALGQNPNLREIQLIDGETPRTDGSYFDSMVIATHAQMFMCPEMELVY